MKNKEKYYNKKIANAEFADDELKLIFEDGIKIKISDCAQNCCEYRYMSTDDDVSFLNGKILTGIEEKEASQEVYNNHVCDEGDLDHNCPDIVFLEIQTSEGSITFANYNEHNGYYGGFSLQIEELPAK